MIHALMVINILEGQFLFAKAFGGTGNDEAWFVSSTQDGGFILAGETESFGAGNNDLLVIRLASDGSLNWARTYGGTTYDYALSVTQSADGGFAVAGVTSSFGAGNYDCLVLKLASDGYLSWARTYGGTGIDTARSIIQTTDGGYAVAGWTWNFGAASADFLILKLNQDGSLAWAKIFGGTKSDYAFSITQTADGGYAVAGWTYSFGAGQADLLILKLSQDGSLSWARTFGGANNDYSSSIIQTTDGGYAVVGSTYGSGIGNWDILLLKINSSGSVVWAKVLGGTNADEAYSITQTTDGGYAVVGHTMSFGSGSYDYMVLKLNPDGSIAWARTLGGTGAERAYSIALAKDSGFAVAGYTNSFGTGNSDFLVLKLNSTGSYPGCVQECSPNLMTVNLSTSSPSVTTATCSPSTTLPTLTLTTPSITVTDACPPGIEETVYIKPGIACSPIPGGALFLSLYDASIKIYSADGRLAYSGDLRKGENRIGLETGVYIWTAGNQKGKVAIR